MSEKNTYTFPPTNETSTQLKYLLNFSMETIILIDKQGFIKNVNDAGIKIFNLPEENILEKNISSFLPTDAQKVHKRILNVITNSKKKFNINYLHQDRCFNCLYTPIVENNEIAGIAIYAKDITKEKTSDEYLRKTIERLTTAEKITHLGYWEWNILKNKVFWSQEMYNIFEQDADSFVPNYKKTLSFIHNQDLKYFKKAIRNVFNRKNKQVSFRITCPSGEIKYLQGNIISDIESKTKNKLIFGTLIDVSIYKKNEIELKKSKERSEKANIEKTRFIATASHDIRQPLHTMELLIKALREIDLEQKPKEIVSKLSISLNNLSTLIDNLLDASKIDIGKIIPRKFLFPIDIIKNSLVEEYKTIAEEKGIMLKAVNCRANIYSDPVIFERILRNLISNAIRYTENGKILIGCRRKNNCIRIEVHDTGAGIPDEKQKQIFKEFQQIRANETIKSSGSGLGLFIVKNLAAIIKTEIRVKSKFGKGTCFYFDIETIEF